MTRAAIFHVLALGAALATACGGSGADGTTTGDAGASADGGATSDGSADRSDAAPSDSASGTDADGATPRSFLAGVNLSVAEFGSLPGTYGSTYTYPTHAEVDYYTGKGLTVFRLPFRWERLQPTLSAALSTTELAHIDDFVTYATGKGANVILDPHNYARYADQIVGGGTPVAAFADFWSRLSDHFKSNAKVIFGLMNEPHDMQDVTWRDDANAAIDAIRKTGATNQIFVPGNYWTGAWQWNTGTHADTMLGIVDPGNNFVYEVHQYLDSDGSGTSATCVSTSIGVDRLKTFNDWAKAHGKRAFLGEVGVAANATCLTAMDAMLSYVQANPEVWTGYAYWAGGPWWGDYIYSIEPTSAGADREQMTTLLKHL